MKYPWKKLFIRKDCDLLTSHDLIRTAYHITWNYTRQKKEYLFIYFKNQNANYYIQGINEFDAARSLYRNKFFTPKQIISSYKKGLDLLKVIKIKTNKWKTVLKKDLKRKNLLEAYLDFDKYFRIISYEYSILPWWALESWQHDFQKLISTLIEQRGLEDQREIIINSLLKSWKKTAIEELQDKYRRGVSVEKLVKNYQFLRSWTAVWFKPVDSVWVENIGKKTKGAELYSLDKVLKMLNPKLADRRFLEAAPYIVFFKDWRDDLRRKNVYLWNFLFSNLAKFFDIEFDDWGYFTGDEIEKILRSGKLDKNIIKNRKRFGCILTVVPDKLDIKVVDKNFTKYLKLVEKVDRIEDDVIIKGIIGQPGKVVGKVCTIRHYKDVFKIKDGEVLVANTTHPNYLMGMKKAVAFVTDEGGIACHAAIVAREMKKPCIVGTKFATKSLKDGDVVEVDAYKGIIRQIN
jgi:phosphohistidine swiveling domain-containing protein